MRPAFFSIVVSVLALVGCVSATFDPSIYPRSLAVMEGVTLHWQLGGSGASRAIRIALTAPTTTGWIGFGIGEPNSGSMPGSDVAIARVDSSSGDLTVEDRYALDFIEPVMDCAQPSDWTPVAATRNSSATTVEFSRLLAVADTKQDRPIVDDGQGTKIIIAYGYSAAFSYHGPTQRTMLTVNFFSSVSRIDSLLAKSETHVMRWAMKDYVIPSEETTYAQTECFAPEFDGAAAYIRGFNVVVQEATKKYVHHIIVRGYSVDGCRGYPVDLWGVASVHVPFVLPDNIGLAMTYPAYQVEIHYNNPEMDPGVVDNAGVDVFYTFVEPTHKAGVTQFGDPIVGTPGELKPGVTAHRYYCPARCTEQFGSDITVFGELLHMHQTGAAIRTDFKFPDGSVRRHEAEYYNFHAQQNILFEPFVMPRGTNVETTCFYKIDPGHPTTGFGLGSSEEMCIHFVYYYPLETKLIGSRCGLNLCGYHEGPFYSEGYNVDFEREFNGWCDATPSDLVELVGASIPDPDLKTPNGQTEPVGSSFPLSICACGVLSVLCLLQNAL
jgi:dopamine beta-monooxygenase